MWVCTSMRFPLPVRQTNTPSQRSADRRERGRNHNSKINNILMKTWVFLSSKVRRNCSDWCEQQAALWRILRWKLLGVTTSATSKTMMIVISAGGQDLLEGNPGVTRAPGCGPTTRNILEEKKNEGAHSSTKLKMLLDHLKIRLWL